VEREVKPAARAQRVLRQRWVELQPLAQFFRLGKSHKVVNVALEGQIASAQSGLPTPAHPRQRNSAASPDQPRRIWMKRRKVFPGRISLAD